MPNTPTPLVDRMLSEVERFQREIIDYPIPAEPTALALDRKDWAHTVLSEELQEFMESSDTEDQADALLDLVYFALGRLIEMGVTPGPWFDEIQRANMAKKRGELSKREGSAGYDAIKPAGWKGPDFKELLQLTLADAMWARVYRENYKAKARRVMLAQRSHNPKIVILGHGRHGKDTACEILQRTYALQFESSSRFLAHEIIEGSDFYKVQGYQSAEEAYEDRSNHRSTWYEMIKAYNSPDKSRLGRALFQEYDIYCGLRSAEEFWAMKNAGLIDFSIWVDASERVPPEDTSSCTVEPWMADAVVFNNNSEAEFEIGLCAAMDRFIGVEK